MSPMPHSNLSGAPAGCHHTGCTKKKKKNSKRQALPILVSQTPSPLEDKSRAYVSPCPGQMRRPFFLRTSNCPTRPCPEQNSAAANQTFTALCCSPKNGHCSTRQQGLHFFPVLPCLPAFHCPALPCWTAPPAKKPTVWSVLPLALSWSSFWWCCCWLPVLGTSRRSPAKNVPSSHEIVAHQGPICCPPCTRPHPAPHRASPHLTSAKTPTLPYITLRQVGTYAVLRVEVVTPPDAPVAFLYPSAVPGCTRKMDGQRESPLGAGTAHDITVPRHAAQRSAAQRSGSQCCYRVSIPLPAKPILCCTLQRRLLELPESCLRLQSMDVR
ncbi:hypothetical protein B0T24DRAFT_135536 [Lasiosphaeria ovina]|uniref:Uncharacterized protein n=1 Tax=Lasiosphaeria ovina TaxID=92902 RepID=A0AAE0JRZ9_9PEZI|nr:hypothetical protein B0T24DRAFT_135536 [Lasiosphaeria ovina]